MKQKTNLKLCKRCHTMKNIRKTKVICSKCEKEMDNEKKDNTQGINDILKNADKKVLKSIKKVIDTQEIEQKDKPIASGEVNIKGGKYCCEEISRQSNKTILLPFDSLEELNRQYKLKWEIDLNVKVWWETYGEKAFNLGIQKALEEYYSCPKCKIVMEHQKGVHTFVCNKCGYKEWYPFRIGDEKVIFNQGIQKSIDISSKLKYYPIELSDGHETRGIDINELLEELNQELKK